MGMERGYYIAAGRMEEVKRYKMWVLMNALEFWVECGWTNSCTVLYATNTVSVPGYGIITVQHRYSNITVSSPAASILPQFQLCWHIKQFAHPKGKDPLHWQLTRNMLSS
jgi:hypothetical protein